MKENTNTLVVSVGEKNQRFFLKSNDNHEKSITSPLIWSSSNSGRNFASDFESLYMQIIFETAFRASSVFFGQSFVKAAF